MQKSYGVVWREEGRVEAGKLELLPRMLRLAGRSGPRDIPYDDLAAIRIGRSAADRLDGRPSIVLDRKSAAPVTISTVAQTDLVGEIAQRLTELQIGAARARRVVVVLPLRAGARDAVRALLDNGPPFDPSVVDGLERHEVLLTPTEAIFLFESSGDGEAAIEALLGKPELWQAAAAWHDHLAGPPQIAEVAYSWRRPEDHDEVSFLATPGPGDSDGGDVF